ncbi:hypothetical protein TA3x_001490 [Tundrisphaera sp. TA3]|uniref:hypothetical protein n=1 Tax=Tundrisphaera sp. TA3 TaxID=3435775 RepID=UPI003EBB0C38
MTHAIPCPICSNAIAIQEARPGRFRIKCPRCSSTFQLAVPDDPALPPVASADPVTPTPVVSPTPPPPPPIPTPDDSAGPPPRWFGGYRVGEALGRPGPMPAYRAHRWAAAGDVALAIMTPRRSADLAFVARWAREAYAASRLDHPNLATVRDLGVVRGRPYLASEPAVPPPADEVGTRPDRSAIVARFLHAARGLKLAHDQAVFHRHFGPGSLVDDEWGTVRVVGLGTGLAPETPTMPAFAPIAVPGVAAGPPDLNDPAVLAAREDVAALGRALRSALGGDTGRGLPPGLASVVRRMVDGGASGPFEGLAAVIAELEAELGVLGPFTPRDEEARAWEDTAQAFREPPLARVRPMVVLGGWGLCGLIAALFLLLGRPVGALGMFGFGGLVAAALVAVRGWFGADPLARRIRELALGGDRADLGTLAAGLGLAVLALGVTHLLWLCLFLGAIAAGLAFAYHFALDRPLAAARAEALGRARLMVQGLRRIGVEEDAIRRFACRQSGRDWEELYEALFGYDSLRAARSRWGTDIGGAKRPRHAAWRDAIADAIDRKLADRRRARDRATLQLIEEHGREAKGTNLLTARRQGRRAAEAMVYIGDQYARSDRDGLGRPLMRAMIDACERPDSFLPATWSESARDETPAWRTALETMAGVLVGPRARFLAGALLLAGSLIWMDQNQIISGAKLKQEAIAAVEDRGQALADVEAVKQKLAESVRGAVDVASKRPVKPLTLSFLPPALATRLDGLGLGVAGVVLLVASLFQGTRIAAFAVPAALVASFGPGLIDGSGRPLAGPALLCHAAAMGLLGLGFAFGRDRD